MSHKHIIYILLIQLVTLFYVSPASGQGRPHNFDTDIRDISNNITPNIYSSAADYIQATPGILTIGLKVFGYEGRSGWGPLMTAGAFSGVLMASVSYGLKYSINRERPNGKDLSFPSGHSAMSFTMATILHKEYGWRSPWFSIGGYTAAALIGVSRIAANEHWMSDIVGGAAIGIGAVHLGYYFSDLIFKDKHLNPEYQKPEFSYDPSIKHYSAELLFGRRFIVGESPFTRGGMVGLSTDIPIIPNTGVSVRLCANSLNDNVGISSNHYSIMAGGYYNYYFARRLELQAKLMAGCGWYQKKAGADISSGLGLNVLLDDNFKIKAFAEYETMSFSSQKPWMHSFVLGWGSSWCF